jgi:hypothetical protein
VGEIVQLTAWLAVPFTVAVYCQFAPTPMAVGGVPEMATTVCCWMTVVLDEPPHPASESRLNRMTT